MSAMVQPPEQALQPIARPAWAFLGPPALTLLIASPMAGLPFSGDPRGFWAPYTLAALPFYLGLLAGPGYIGALTQDPPRLRSSALRRFWVRASLALGLCCALVGIWAGAMMFLFAVPALATAICCVVLWWRFERVGRPPEGH